LEVGRRDAVMCSYDMNAVIRSLQFVHCSKKYRPN
jgi:hypothetical protein